MALLNLGDDPWLLEYESCEKLQRNIMEQLQARSLQPKNSKTYSTLNSAIRIRLKQFNNELDQLRDKLEEVSATRMITCEEIEKRLRQIELLNTKSLTLDKLYNEDKVYVEQPSNLANNPDWKSSRDDQLLGAAGGESFDEIQRQKQRMLADQEEGLQNLSKIIGRQINIAQTITSEVDLQNDLLDDLGTQLDGTNARIGEETRHISVVDRKDKTCIYWVIIVLLFLSIITVVAI